MKVGWAWLLGVGVLLVIAVITTPTGHAQPITQLKAGVVKITSRVEGTETVGTGIIVRLEKDAAYIATASHVVEGDPNPLVTFFANPTRSHRARILGLDGGNPKGLAALVVEGNLPKGVRALPLEPTISLSGGEGVTIIGFPQIAGVPWAVTDGSITGFRGPDLVFSGEADNGNSGGPLLLDGRVVGIVTRKIGSFGDAVPAQTARFALQNWIGPLAKVVGDQTPEAGSPVEKDGAPTVLIRAGEFWMGSPEGEGDSDEHPRRKVYLDAYYMDQYEVTVRRYGDFMQTTNRGNPAYWDQVQLARDGNKPVVGISWHDATAYCEWAGRRLPTEAEWEKAARGTNERKYPWGNDPLSSTLANYDQSVIVPTSSNLYRERLKPVGSYEGGKSPYGIDDMAGNVGEWVADWYAESYYQQGENRNPKGPSTAQTKVLRGGGRGTVIR